jgi:broad specificity phosphatase PhoE
MIDYFKTLSGRHNVYFLRHGESRGNSARIIQGRHDPVLSERGLRQSEAVAPWFGDREIEAILCSPLQRARQTAEAVSRVIGVQRVEPRDDLTELDTGIFTGLTVEQIRRRHPQEWRSFQRSSWEGVPGAERIADLLGRAESLWRDLGRRISEGRGNLLCVTHSGILQWIIKATFGQRSWMPLVPVENCSICHFSLDNNPGSENPRYYFEWTRLNFRPAGGEDTSGHIFLEA